MPNPERQLEQEENKSGRQLNQSLEKLRTGLNSQQKNQGLSSKFHEQMESIEGALVECEKAMETLSKDYVQELEKFKNESDPLNALRALDASETIWKKETEVIRKNEKVVHEEAFLRRMREQAVMVYDNKLLELTSRRRKSPSTEEIALCLGILGNIDQGLGELGHPVTSKERVRLSEIAKAFR
ncbi:hypothetical protein SCG7109_AB_00140 [Chlamydiales bacterium SCGC AG-110-M15]|nr:hypothetical protein SCG7109_AB_00140 [Chlamydiales bacterium SCGC AG-110-M15]